MTCGWYRRAASAERSAQPLKAAAICGFFHAIFAARLLGQAPTICPTMGAEKIKKVRVTELRLGMFLHALVGNWLDHPFWKTRFVLSDPADLRRLVDLSLIHISEPTRPY